MPQHAPILLQDDFDRTAAQHLALADANLTAKASSMQPLPDSRTRAASTVQGGAVQLQMNDVVGAAAVDSPTLQHQVSDLACLRIDNQTPLM